LILFFKFLQSKISNLLLLRRFLIQSIFGQKHFKSKLAFRHKFRTMNDIQEIIESGKLELYVLNVLPYDESTLIESLFNTYPQIRHEIEEIQATLQLYAKAHYVTPNMLLKNEIMDSIEKSNDPIQNQTKSKLTKVLSPKRSPLSIVASILPWVAAATLAGASFFFFNKNQESIKALEECKKATQQMDKHQKVIIALQQKIDVITSPTTKSIELKGLESSPKAKVTIYWNSMREATYLVINNLPPPEPNKQYQLWAIVDKKPVDAGVFKHDLADVQTMKAFEKAEAFAVTLEPLGGSENPTLDKMIVLGTL
jgi:anti-sigma-K factor RskA